MRVQGQPYRTIWMEPDDSVWIIDQRFLPHRFVTQEVRTADEMAVAIREMHVRGAGLIGAAAAFGMYLAARESAATGDYFETIRKAAGKLIAARPTAVNLEWAVTRQLAMISDTRSSAENLQVLKQTAQAIADEDAAFCHSIGLHGSTLIRDIAQKKNGAPVNILTHCNAGWLAFVDYGSATAPIYEAFDNGIPLHVWVDETRPRNQGASLTAWELLNHGVPHTLIADNTGGHLMQHGRVDLVITGADRVTRAGDAANKIGTYLKALAAQANNVPLYVALPSSTFDWNIRDGIRDIPIEERSGNEVKYITGLHGNELVEVLVAPEKSPALNYGFDVTPAALITGLITERGICAAAEADILRLFPEKR
ncbi:MAG TPA: S-methyl-5-thioribose-1-phosphate isomerase [Flavisolibacter sp.]